MPKVFALHEVVLPPGMTAEEYEQVYGEELASLPDLQGWKTYLLKGDRGEGAGKLQLMFEIESVEARDRYFPRPGPGGESEEFRQFQEHRVRDPHESTNLVLGGKKIELKTNGQY